MPRTGSSATIRRVLRHILLAGCAIGCTGDGGSPFQPASSASPYGPMVRESRFVVQVDTRAASVKVESRRRGAGGAAPTLSILGTDAIGINVSNYSASAVGELAPDKVRIKFDVSITNRLPGVELAPVGFAAAPTQLMLFPVVSSIAATGNEVRVSRDEGAVVTTDDLRSGVTPSSDWNGNAPEGTDVWFDFTRNITCSGPSTSCTRWEAFPPLAGGESSTTRTVGFDVEAGVADFQAHMLLAADLRPVTPGPGPTVPPPPGDFPGIPFGSIHLPAERLGENFTATLRTATPSRMLATLDSARQAGNRILLAVARSKSTNPDGSFNLSLWKEEVDQYRAYDLQPYLSDGTLMGLYIIDEPNCGNCWGGQTIAPATVDELGRYTKSIWPSMITFARVVPSWFYRYGPPRYVDVAWAQWEGPLHVPSAGMTAQEFRDASMADARALGMSLVMGMNVLSGGDGSSGIAGTYDLRTVSTRWQMSAAEVERVGLVFAAAPGACAMISWRWSPDYQGGSYLTPAQVAGIRAFDTRSDVQAAWQRIGAVARNRDPVSCGPRAGF